MSKHHREHCCPPMYNTMGYGASGYYGAGYGGAGYGITSSGAAGLKWFYALLLLIVIVLQFGKRQFPVQIRKDSCDDGAAYGACGLDGLFKTDAIDNSVLFIIVVFLLILCGGCFGGSAYV